MSVAEEFELFAASRCEGRSPTYAQLSRGVAADPDPLAIPPGDPVPALRAFCRSGCSSWGERRT